MKLEPMKVYGTDFEKKVKDSSEKVIREERPCIAFKVDLQHINLENIDYKGDAHLMVPLDDNYNEDIDQYKVKLMVLFDDQSHTITYDFEETINSSIKSWIHKYNKHT